MNDMYCNTNRINQEEMNALQNNVQNDLQSPDIKNILFKCLKYKLTNHKLLVDVLNEIVKKHTTPYEYYEYFRFTHNQYKHKVIERYLYHYVKIEHV